jgi:RNA polymerase-binding protein DksA
VAKKAKKTSKKKTTAKKAPARKKARVNETSLRKRKTKKAVAKKKRKSKAARQPRRRALTTEELQHFREVLLRKWAELVGDVNSIEKEALKKSRLDAAGDLSSMPIHMADLGTDNFEQEFAIGLMDSERKILAEISAALRRIDEGVYGICEGTGRPIVRARLEANPWARYCIKYATMVEQGLVKEGEKVSEESEEGPEYDDELAEADELEDEDEPEESDLEDYDETDDEKELD